MADDGQLDTARMRELMPLCAHLDMRLTLARADHVVAALDWSEQLTTTGGALHGGALMSLADAAGAVCAFLNLPPGAHTSTTSSSTVFIRGVRGGTVTATARPLHAGRSTIAVQVELTDDDGRLLAQTTQSQAVLGTAGA
jgi:1,4-dihydroxy-2-naphthoyl-CoA hydrolase